MRTIKPMLKRSSKPMQKTTELRLVKPMPKRMPMRSLMAPKSKMPSLRQRPYGGRGIKPKARKRT